MSSKWLMPIRYLLAGEESRNNRSDYWNSVYLAGMSPLNRSCLILFKVLFLLGLSAAAMTGLSWF
ncbi:MAG: hypothetical protein D3926_12940 [Desulfobacteraceae bacterium]|nr:MAG: hypothetical protein D3926_12940 [Desulfobacteraceae bacterium]